MTTEVPLLRQFAQASARKKQLDDELRAIEEQLKAMQPEVQEYFLEHGMQNARVDGMTLYIHQQLWAKAKDGDTETACAVMKQFPELRGFVHETFNVNTVSSYVRELARENRLLPETVAAVLDVREEKQIRARRS